ncbi:MAG: IS630 family transposase [Chloroflexota bacterium]
MGKEKKYKVKLTTEERDHLRNLVSTGSEKARKLTRARILLKADEDWQDKDIAEALDVSYTPILQTRKRYVEEGLDLALNGYKPGKAPQSKLDGQAEAHLIALTCSDPPPGYARWSLRLLAEQLVQLEQIELESISYETVRQCLKKNELKPWQNKQWVIPPKHTAAFVCAMEEVLDLYCLPYNSRAPVVCLDEGLKQLISQVRQPLPLIPGQPRCYDYEYKREGSCSFFLAFEPLRCWRTIDVTGQRTMIDYAHFLKRLADIYFPPTEIDIIHLIQDNLNTHKAASLYEAFSPKEAKRILNRFQFHFTPKHGSWLNMAEIELSILTNQCLDRRIASKSLLQSEIQAWVQARNSAHSTINWQFTTQDARIKLKKLYPLITL